MKKILLILLFVIQCFVIFAQERIGYTEEEIKNDFSDYIIKTNYSIDNTKLISIDFSFGKTFYSFNEYGICDLVVVFPNDLDALNVMVKYFNTHYIAISSTHWKKYSAKGVIDIYLDYDNDGPSFVFKKE